VRLSQVHAAQFHEISGSGVSAEDVIGGALRPGCGLDHKVSIIAECLE